MERLANIGRLLNLERLQNLEHRMDNLEWLKQLFPDEEL